jgi:sigma-B regulation protein RsbU (phosphoserine phosphatase)
MTCPTYAAVVATARSLGPGGMPLGLMPGMSYEEKEMVLEEGEAAFFYTDGLVEAHDPKGRCSDSQGLGS